MEQMSYRSRTVWSIVVDNDRSRVIADQMKTFGDCWIVQTPPRLLDMWFVSIDLAVVAREIGFVQSRVMEVKCPAPEQALRHLSCGSIRSCRQSARSGGKDDDLA